MSASTTPTAPPSILAAEKLSPEAIRAFMTELFGADLHAKRVLSLANGVIGAVRSAALCIHAIGLGLALATESNPKHAIKQVDRLLSNTGVDPWMLLSAWVPFVVADRKELLLALDWTDFDDDDQSTCALHLVTAHGRSTPLVWKTVRKSELAGARNQTESEVLERLDDLLPEAVNVTVLADRGFGDQKRYAWLATRGWDWVIRFRGNIQVRNALGEVRRASEWVAPNGRATQLKSAEVTGDRMPVAAVVFVKKAKMKDAWCLCTSRKDLRAAEVVALYARRFTIEESFRDTKDPRFGLGMSATHIQDCGRRDRLLLIATLAQALLTLLGAAAERCGLDKKMQANTSKKRQHSLFNQGSFWYSYLPTLREEWLSPLMNAFAEIVAEHQVFRALTGVL
jgi:hypothetical protein